MVQKHMESTNKWKPKKHGLQNHNSKLWLLKGDLAFDLFTVYALLQDPTHIEARFFENNLGKAGLDPKVAGEFIEKAIAGAFRPR